MRLVIVLCALVAAGCSRPERVEIAAILDDADAAAYFAKRARELGVDAITHVATDVDAQAALVDDVLGAGVKVLVVEPLATPDGAARAARYVELAHERGTSLIAYDRAIESAELDHHAGFDRYRVGVLQSEAAIAAIGPRGRVALDPGDPEIARGWENTLAPYSITPATPADADAILLAGGSLEGAGTASPTTFVATVASTPLDPSAIRRLCAGGRGIAVVLPERDLARAAVEAARRQLEGPPARESSRTQEERERGGAAIRVAGTEVSATLVRPEVVTAPRVWSVLGERGQVPAEQLAGCAR